MNKIKNFIEQNQKYSVAIIRIGLALVLLWFGINQAFDSDSFLGYIPAWAMPNHMHMMHFPQIEINTIIIFNGISEIIIGLFLLVGLYTRIFAFIAAMHLFIIAVSLIFSGAGSLSLDSKKDKK